MTTTDERPAAPEPEAAPPPRPKITEPGVYDLEHAEYHSDPVVGGSLSSTGIRQLLKSPAHYRAYVDGDLDDDDKPSKALDEGSVVHNLLLGTGAEYWATDTDGRTKAGKQIREQAREAGAIIVSTKFLDRAQRMVDAVRNHPTAGQLLEPGTGWPEQTLVWQDRRTGLWCRAMLDWLPHWASESGLFFCPDPKTARSSRPELFNKAMWEYGYHIQAAWYLAGVRALGLAGQATPTFVFIAIESSRPHNVTVIQPGAAELYWAEVQIQAALDRYLRCQETGHWPGYSDEIVAGHLPPYAIRELENAQDAGQLPIPDAHPELRYRR